MVFAFKWLRRFVRSHTNPIPVDKAELWRNRLSALYLFLGFNTMGVIMIAAYRGKMDWAEYYGIKSEEELNTSPGKLWATTLGIKNPRVYRVSGFTVTDITDDAPEAKDQESLEEPHSEFSESESEIKTIY